MRLSPDEMVFWHYGVLKLNAPIVFTWGLMLVLAVGSKLVTRQALNRTWNDLAGKSLLEIVVTGHRRSKSKT